MHFFKTQSETVSSAPLPENNEYEPLCVLCDLCGKILKRIKKLITTEITKYTERFMILLFRRHKSTKG